jgi:4-alpha-glucanotransferase
MSKENSITAPPDLQLRRAGVLLHPTSLPSGKLDSDVDHWLQMMAKTGFSVWQVLPLCEPQIGLSPYQCSSTFAINPVLLSEFPDIDAEDSDFAEFCNEQQYWLDDYVLFKVLKQYFEGAAWTEWPQQWKQRDPLAMQQIAEQYKQDITELKWQQYQLDKRWQEIRAKATEMGILLFGDLPIYIGYDSADVWAHPELFLLDSDGNMDVVTGVPPDYFSETGQRWGNPHYDWSAMHEDDYAWWKSRIQHHLEQFDLLRIDHFRGLESAWMIDAACETAVDGRWQKIPGDALLSGLQDGDKQLPFVAEDLGIITPEVTALRKKYNLPGMAILQFGFDEFEDNPHKLQNIEEDKIVYTGTHDNDTTKGWFNSLDDHVKNIVLESLNMPVIDSYDPNNLDIYKPDVNYSCWHDTVDIADIVVEKMVDNAMQSPARICIIPVQDCLHLDSEARMNTPGTIEGNWTWRFQWDQVEHQHDSSRMKKMRLRLDNAQRLVKPNG